MESRNYSLFRDIIILLTFIGVAIMTFQGLGLGITKAEAAEVMHRDVIAIQAVPVKTHEYVSVEAGAFYDTDSGEEVFTAGAGFAVAGYSLGVAVAHDGKDMDSMMMEQPSYSVAIGTSARLGDYADFRVGIAPKLFDVEERGWGTIGANIRFGF